MKKVDIESLLRGNKPQVKDNPTFLLEVQQKMRAVEGIKIEVDRQRRSGRYALVLALFAGFTLGCIAAALAYLYPVNPETIGDNLMMNIKALIDPWKHYVLLLIACCAIALGVIFSFRKVNSRII